MDRLKALTGRELESHEELAEWTSDKKVEFVVDKLIENDIPVAPIYQMGDVVYDPQVKARGMIIEYEHPRAGMIRQPNFPIQFSKTPAVTRPAPILGQHNVEILRSLLGYREDEIVKLKEDEVIT